MGAHRSDSAAQRAAERPILDWLSSDKGRGLPPLLSNQKVMLSGGSAVVVDGKAADDSTFVEVYARVSPIKGAGFHKIARDILKLSLIRQQHPQARLVIAFAGPAAAGSIRGWLLEAAVSAGIELVAADVPELHEGLLAAQARQRMDNAPDEPRDGRESR